MEITTTGPTFGSYRTKHQAQANNSTFLERQHDRYGPHPEVDVLGPSTSLVTSPDTS